MDKILKFLSGRTKKERRLLLLILSDVRSKKLDAYDVKHLKGYKNIYRLRKGKFRITFNGAGSRGIVLDLVYRKDAYKKK